jgi:hypothetical protein
MHQISLGENTQKLLRILSVNHEDTPYFMYTHPFEGIARALLATIQ